MSDKKSLRQSALETRSKTHLDDNGMAARKVAAQVIMLPELDVVRTIAGYIPIKSELNCLVVLKALHAARFPLCLPTIVASEAPLEFRSWDMRTALSDGPFGTKQSSEEMVVPEILLVPLVAFDENGARLGYGGGYYDRTLQELRLKNQDLVAIGIAFENQKLATIPTEDYDQPLNMVVTETTTYRFE